MPEDIISTLKEMKILDHKKRANANVVVNKSKIRDWIDNNNVKLTPPVDHDAFIMEDTDDMEEEMEE